MNGAAKRLTLPGGGSMDVTIPAGIREARDFDGQPGTIFRLVITVGFVFIMAAYGISSFRRARKISRS